MNRLWRLLHGRGFYQITGEQKKTLRAELNLQPGELVEIKSPAEIRGHVGRPGPEPRAIVRARDGRCIAAAVTAWPGRSATSLPKKPAKWCN